MELITESQNIASLPADSPRFRNCSLNADNVHETMRHYTMMPLTAVILLSNISVLFLLCKCHFRRPDILLVASLCCADLLVGAVCIATIITKAEESTLSLCLTRTGVALTSVIGSFLTLVAVAFDRLLAIECALKYSSLVTPRKTGVVIVVLWACAFVSGSLPLVGWNRGQQFYGYYCAFILVMTPSFIGAVFSLCCASIVVILIIHVYLYTRARVHIRRIDALQHVVSQTSGRRLGMSGRSWSSVCTVMLVTGCVMTCWCPFLFAGLYALLAPDPPCVLYEVLETHLLVLGYTNSALNPVVYALRNHELKAIAITFWIRMCGKNNT